MPKPICVESTAVKVSVDELMTELLRRMPLEHLTDALFSACQGARKRLGTKRHNRYKSEKFFRRAVGRLPEIPPALAAAVGIKTSEPLTSPDITVDEPASVKPVLPAETENIKQLLEEQLDLASTDPDFSIVTPLQTPNQPGQVVVARLSNPAVIDRPGRIKAHLNDPKYGKDVEREIDGPLQELLSSEKNQGSEPEPAEPPPPSQDEFAELMDIPLFEHYENVFGTYPYVWETTSKSGERRLVLGYASARNRETDGLVRRNCAYTAPDGNVSSFNDLPSIVGLLKSAANGVRRHIKVLPYHPGSKVRFWTNVAGKGDREDLYRHILITEDGLKRVNSRVAYDKA